MAFLTVSMLLLPSILVTSEARETPFIRGPAEETSQQPVNEADQAGSVSGDPYSTVLPLNDVLFGPNVLQSQDSDAAAHWVVYFCPSWWEPCRDLLKPFAMQSAEWQRRVNDGLLGNQIRFARVDCASHKPLCNAQKVDNYPSVQHYFQGRLVSKWTATGRNDDKRLEKWLAAELSSVPAASAVLRKAADPRLFVSEVIASHFISRNRLLDLFVLFAVLALNFWNVCRHTSSVQKPKNVNNDQLCHHFVAPVKADDEWRSNTYGTACDALLSSSNIDL